ncbi:MAG: hypothetical protein Q8O33_19040 [Pseudomonadota bacterium]|nr:hypothetical protein [Pseudomonadota bacterium]
MSGVNTITTIDANNSAFQRSYQGIKPDIRREAQQAIGMLLCVDVDNPPARLHLHTLTSKTVPSVLAPGKRVKVYTFHLTSNDAWKASFTLENGTAYLRLCGPHDKIDKNP